MVALLDWLIRYGHVASAAVWTGGYALLAVLLYPLLRREDRQVIARIAEPIARMLSYAGTATFAFGLLLIWRTRGYGNLLSGEWGMLVLGSVALGTFVLGLNDSALRPRLRRMANGGTGNAAQRLTLVALAALLVAIGCMTRAVYAVA
ncbi:MAG: hypothetical protein DCC58_00080 [Chloroflexi bacterium]|nr:MAG: hypothetical protein DCC58_00080 [Chloroflexota bacterium]